MSSTTPALVAGAPSAAFVQTTIERRDLRDDDIRIDIAYAGICHSDIHQVREEWGEAAFPMVPGHEIAGVVSEVGAGVTRHKVGDRVGVGCMVDSCGECELCKDGHENFCTKGTVWTYNSDNYDGEPAMGGYSQEIVVSERFVCRIPDALELDVAAPLMCAGITTYTPLKRWGAGSGVKVGVVGLGGLGHMGVKLAVAMGADVTVLSQTTNKKDDSLAFGAVDHRATSDPQTFEDLAGHFDLILSTVSATLPMESFLGMIRPFGAFVTVGMPEHDQPVPLGELNTGDKVIAGSNIGGIVGTQEMLDFCAAHGIGASIETISADQVDAAYDRVVASDVRYRFVIDVSTISPQ